MISSDMNDLDVIQTLLGTLLYVIITVVLYLIIGVAFSASELLVPDLIIDIWNMWLIVGAILGVADVIFVSEYILDAFSGF